MRRLFLLTAIIVFTGTAFAQNVDLRRKIEVSGTAEQEVTPDIINVSISLQEYTDGKTRVTIDQLESQLENAVKDAGIPKEDFTINNISSYNYYYGRKKDYDFLPGKQYNIRFHDLDKFNQVLSKVDQKGIQYTNIYSYDYSKMTEVKRELKIRALMAAKEKATYLLNSINEKLGGVIEITEADNRNYPAFNTASTANTIMAGSSSGTGADIDFKKIKLSFQINAVFEIAK